MTAPEPSTELRQLCIGARIKERNMAAFALSERRRTLDSLYHHGWAERHSNGESGKYETFTYVATRRLLDWAHQRQLDRKTFDQALAQIDVKKARAKFLAERRAKRAGQLVFPGIKSVVTRLLVAEQGPGVTTNDDGEFSSRALTDWYVQQFCKANNLRSAA